MALTNLTEKELFIVDELSHGFTRCEIAERQHRSVEVVKKHISHAMTKMHARNAVHLIALAKDLGLITLVICCFVGALGSAEQVDLRKGRWLRSFSVRNGRVRGSEV
ncbi:MAG: hypothetical protein DRQ62_09925 [Gammaproteobacteria bacterium]|nr:MAG: hypothetical protein DRQ62_09925 [Gammaproteobacteria bacterium]